MCLLVLLLMNGAGEPPPEKKLEPVSHRLRHAFPLGEVKSFNPVASLDAKTLLGSNDRGAWTINLDDGYLDRRVPFEPGATIWRVVLSPDQRTLFVARAGRREDKLVKEGVSSTIYRELGGLSAYDLASGKKLPTFDGRDQTSVTDLVASPDGRWLAFTERTRYVDPENQSYRCVLWDLGTNQSSIIANERAGGDFSPDSREVHVSLLSKSRVGQLVRLSLPSGEKKVIAEEPNAVVSAHDFSADNRWMTVHRVDFSSKGGNRAFELRRRQSQEVEWRASVKDDSLNRCVFDPFSRFVALVDRAGVVYLFNLETRTQLKAFNLPKKTYPWYPQFSPDGNRFAIITEDEETIRIRGDDPNSYPQSTLWLLDLSKPTQPERVVLPRNRATRFLWMPDGKSIVVPAIGFLYVLDATNIAPSTR